MKKGQIFEGTVERVDFPDKGIVHIEGEKVAIKHGLPGQKIKFMITKKKSNKLEGQILEILEKSSEEKTEGICPHFGQCGGCTYNSLPSETENQVKEAQMRRLLEPIIGEGVYEGVKEPPKQREYRNKMEFSFGDEYNGGPLALGMHRRGSFYDVLTVSDCQIVDGDFRKILVATRDYFAGNQVEFYRKMQHTGYLRHLMVRKAVSTGEIMVDNIEVTKLTQQEKDAYRLNNIGYIFQDFKLIEDMTVEDNLNLLKIGKVSCLLVEDVLDSVGIKNKKKSKIKHLSGGERQRVAIARALIKEPKIIIADEPTGNLNFENGKKVVELLINASKKFSNTMLVVTHDDRLVPYFDESLHFEDMLVKKGGNENV